MKWYRPTNSTKLRSPGGAVSPRARRPRSALSSACSTRVSTRPSTRPSRTRPEPNTSHTQPRTWRKASRLSWSGGIRNSRAYEIPRSTQGLTICSRHGLRPLSSGTLVGAAEVSRLVNARKSGLTHAPKTREKPQQIADELRQLIIVGELDEGDSLGHEPDLIERFGVSRPSLREALRILEAEGLITVVRGVQGGVVVHRPDKRLTARTAAIVLQARNVPLADVFEARTILEPAAVRLLASSRNRKANARRLRAMIAD